jgi:hypothetical protein
MFSNKVGYYFLIILSYASLSFTFRRMPKFKKGDKVISRIGNIYIIDSLAKPRPHEFLRPQEIFYCGHKISDSHKDCNLAESQLKKDTI